MRNLTPFMPHKKFFFDGTAGLNVSILAEFPTLKEAIIPIDATGIEALKRLPQLRLLSFRSAKSTGTEPTRTPAEFWKEYDAKKGVAPK
jgi:hypothetical protein